MRHCSCFAQDSSHDQPRETRFHTELQDTDCDGWKMLLELVDIAAAEGWTEFAPGRYLPQQEWARIVTLPRSIARLKSVRHLLVNHSHLVRLPAEIGAMDSLEEFDAYVSHGLHWFPYEITRCKRLKESTVSTRSLYGNYKYRPPFPRLEMQRSSTAGLDLSMLAPGVTGTDSAAACSVCNCPLADTGLYQAWLSMRVATDVLPLLVNACSVECVSRLPAGAPGYVATPHRRGTSLEQPPPER